MTGQIRIGVVGCGNHMLEFLLGCMKWTPAAQVVAACDILPERIARLQRIYNVPGGYTDIADMLSAERLDAVIIAAGHASNAALAEAALRAGVHVFLEKTPCASTAEAEALVEVQQQSGKSLMVGWNRRFMTSYVMARQVADKPEFGPVRMYHSQFHATPYRSEDFFKINHVIHHLDLARFFMGEIELTYIDRVAVDNQRVGYNINFRSQAGGVGVIQSGSLLDETYPMERLELVGNGQNVVVDNVKNFVYNRAATSRKDNYARFEVDNAGDALVWNPNHGIYPRYSHHGYENELRHFFDCVMDGSTPSSSIGDSVGTLRLLDDMSRLLASQE